MRMMDPAREALEVLPSPPWRLPRILMIKSYPLAWPGGWKRTANREESRFRRQTHVYQDGVKQRTGARELSVSEANERVLRELRGMNVIEFVVSTNLVLTSMGTPRSGQREPSDPGAAVYWEKSGKSQCMAIDQYDRVADNLAAIAASLSALRAIERHGGAQIMERAFIGFMALPENVAKPWREVFHFAPDFRPTREVIQATFLGLARMRHSDHGGSDAAMSELNLARDAAFREIEG